MKGSAGFSSWSSSSHPDAPVFVAKKYIYVQLFCPWTITGKVGWSGGVIKFMGCLCKLDDCLLYKRCLLLMTQLITMELFFFSPLQFSPDITSSVPHHKHYALEIIENSSPIIDHCIIRSSSVGKCQTHFTELHKIEYPLSVSDL